MERSNRIPFHMLVVNAVLNFFRGNFKNTLKNNIRMILLKNPDI